MSYLKLEDDRIVHDRFKYVPGDFLKAIRASDSHWRNRSVLPNALVNGTDIFASALGLTGAYDAPA
ncbi:hypothetical protein [Roseobacter weihaiensis]|uniref:hypothetical protein n=1 Tax=Roseobacter weihaiensis TaxID=2763262 RepID=UPI001D0A7BDA|nr:hypothetical protein [Roseobacter sp. H9]